MNENNVAIYQDDTQSYTLMYFDNIKNFKEWLELNDFIDAGILGDNWWTKNYRVYKLPDDYIKQLTDNQYVCMEFVGHLNWVIPREKQTDSQYYFIERIFEPY